MNHGPQIPIDRNELAESLRRLGVHEIEERLEVSTLLAVTTGPTNPDDASVCCSCKFPPEVLTDGKLPYPQIDLQPGGDIPSGL